MTLRSDLHHLVQRAERQGLRAQYGGGHVKVYGNPEKTGPFVTTSSTPSDYRSLANFASEVRRVHGVEVTDKPQKAEAKPHSVRTKDVMLALREAGTNGLTAADISTLCADGSGKARALAQKVLKTRSSKGSIVRLPEKEPREGHPASWVYVLTEFASQVHDFPADDLKEVREVAKKASVSEEDCAPSREEKIAAVSSTAVAADDVKSSGVLTDHPNETVPVSSQSAQATLDNAIGYLLSLPMQHLTTSEGQASIRRLAPLLRTVEKKKG